VEESIVVWQIQQLDPMTGGIALFRILPGSTDTGSDPEAQYTRLTKGRFTTARRGAMGFYFTYVVTNLGDGKVEVMPFRRSRLMQKLFGRGISIETVSD
jgi:hypothetical protein